jgi:hypothetical protein
MLALMLNCITPSRAVPLPSSQIAEFPPRRLMGAHRCIPSRHSLSPARWPRRVHRSLISCFRVYPSLFPANSLPLFSLLSLLLKLSSVFSFLKHSLAPSSFLQSQLSRCWLSFFWLNPLVIAATAQRLQSVFETDFGTRDHFHSLWGLELTLFFERERGFGKDFN